MQFQVDKIRCYDKVLRSIVKNCDSATVSMHVDFSLGELTIQSREGIHAILCMVNSPKEKSTCIRTAIVLQLVCMLIFL